VALAVTPQNDDNRGIVDNGNDDANDDRIKCDFCPIISRSGSGTGRTRASRWRLRKWRQQQ